MSDIEARVRKIVADQLGVAEADIKTNRRLSMIWVQTRSTPSSSSWPSKKPSAPKFRTKKLKDYDRPARD